MSVVKNGIQTILPVFGPRCSYWLIWCWISYQRKVNQSGKILNYVSKYARIPVLRYENPWTHLQTTCSDAVLYSVMEHKAICSESQWWGKLPGASPYLPLSLLAHHPSSPTLNPLFSTLPLLSQSAFYFSPLLTLYYSHLFSVLCPFRALLLTPIIHFFTGETLLTNLKWRIRKLNYQHKLVIY